MTLSYQWKPDIDDYMKLYVSVQKLSVTFLFPTGHQPGPFYSMDPSSVSHRQQPEENELAKKTIHYYLLQRKSSVSMWSQGRTTAQLKIKYHNSWPACLLSLC